MDEHGQVAMALMSILALMFYAGFDARQRKTPWTPPLPRSHSRDDPEARLNCGRVLNQWLLKGLSGESASALGRPLCGQEERTRRQNLVAAGTKPCRAATPDACGGSRFNSGCPRKNSLLRSLIALRPDDENSPPTLGQVAEPRDFASATKTAERILVRSPGDAAVAMRRVWSLLKAAVG